MGEELAELQRQGFFLIRALYDTSETRSISEAVDALFLDSPPEKRSPVPGEDQSIRSQRGKVYAARNLHEICPQFDSIWMRPNVCAYLTSILGPQFGLVRALYFDKHPERTWSLPWHRDRTIAVEDNSLASEDFTKPTLKAGIPHVEAPSWLLKQMVTLRIHLDPVTEDNGPLIVRAGDFEGDSDHASSADGDTEEDTVSITCDAGDVLVMRPLLLHMSPSSVADSNAHRRIIHMEFSSQQSLPGGFRWRTFQQPILT